MKIKIAVYTAQEGYSWQPGTELTKQELISYKQCIGRFPSADSGTLPFGGIFLQDDDLVFYRYHLAKKFDFRGRDALYCVLGVVKKSDAAAVDPATLFALPEFAAPMRPFPTAAELPPAEPGTVPEWLRNLEAMSLDVRITGSPEMPNYKVTQHSTAPEPAPEPDLPPEPAPVAPSPIPDSRRPEPVAPRPPPFGYPPISRDPRRPYPRANDWLFKIVIPAVILGLLAGICLLMRHRPPTNPTSGSTNNPPVKVAAPATNVVPAAKTPPVMKPSPTSGSTNNPPVKVAAPATNAVPAAKTQPVTNPAPNEVKSPRPSSAPLATL